MHKVLVLLLFESFNISWDVPPLSRAAIDFFDFSMFRKTKQLLDLRGDFPANIEVFKKWSDFSFEK